MFSDPTTTKPYPKVLAFGDAKCGKTALVLSMGLGGKPVAVIDTEAGTDLMSSGYMSHAGIVRPNVKVLHTQSPVDAVAAMRWMQKNREQFAGLAIDSATVLWEMAQDAKMTNAGRVALGDWNAVKLPIRRLYNEILAAPLPTIVTCRLKTVSDSDGNQVGVKPDYEKGAAYPFDLIIQMLGPAHDYAAMIFGSRVHEWPAGTMIQQPTWAKIMDPIAYRFNVATPAHQASDPYTVGQQMYGETGAAGGNGCNGGVPNPITAEEALAKIAEAKALPHLANIWNKYGPAAKAGGWIDQFTAAKDARKARLSVDPPPPDSPPAGTHAPIPHSPQAQPAGTPNNGGATAQSPSSPQAGAPAVSPYSGMTFEQLVAAAAPLAIGSGEPTAMTEYATACAAQDRDALVHLAVRMSGGGAACH